MHMTEPASIGKTFVLASLAVVTVTLVAVTAHSLLTRNDSARPLRNDARLPRTDAAVVPEDADEKIDSTSVPTAANKVRVVTAANFAAGDSCYDHYTEGCDLYSAVLDLSTGAVSEVTRLTSDPLGEAWPQIASDGRTIAFTRFGSSIGSSDAMAVDLLTLASRLLVVGASNVSPMPDSASAMVTTMPGFKLKTISLSDANQSLGSESLATGVHEPHVSADGTKVAYYATGGGGGRGSGTAQAKVYLVTSKTTVDASEADGSAHCFWNFDGSSLYCNDRNSGGITVRTVGGNGAIGAQSVGIKFPTVAEMAAADPAYGNGACQTVSVQYGSFCDKTRVALVAGCVGTTSEGAGEQIFSHAILMDVTTRAITPIGARMAEAFGGPGTHSWTTACGAI